MQPQSTTPTLSQLRERLEAAYAASTVVLEAYAAGKATQLDLLDAAVALRTARLDFTRAEQAAFRQAVAS